MEREQEVRCCGVDFWLYIMVISGLLLFSGLMSGLTLGLMSLGVVDLEVIKKSGKPRDRKYAEKILPVVKRRHLLLVTLLVGNALAMEALPLFLDSLVGTWIAIVLSVTLLLMFGEILPQAVCSQYGLAIGAALAPFVKILLFLLLPISWPVSKLLDFLLGSKHVGLFGRAQLKTLVDMHGNEAGKGGELSNHETRIIARALELAGKTAKCVMTPVDVIFSVDVQSLKKIDNKMMMSIISAGYSRIPVYQAKPNNIVGLLVVKNFVNITIEQMKSVPIPEIPVKKLFRVSEDMPLYDVLDAFQQSKSQMAAVVRSSFQQRGSSKVVPMDLHVLSNAVDDFGFKDSSRIKQPAGWKAHDDHDEEKPVMDKEKGDFGIGGLKQGHSWGPWTDEEGEAVGIITREDVIQELLKENVLDESVGKVVVSIVNEEFTQVTSTNSPCSNPSLRSTNSKGRSLQPLPPEKSSFNETKRNSASANEDSASHF